jgi:hypothetical protein
MAGGLGTFLVALAAPLARKVMFSLGLGVVSYGALTAALTAALSAAKQNLAGFTGDALSILQNTGVFTAMSIIAGALTARVGLMVLKRFEVLK